jgi:glutathione S-transferase
MKEIIVHSVPGSPFGRAVLATLEEKALPYRFSVLGPQDMRSPRHFSLHPFGRVPILQHGEFVVYETQAILRYLDRLTATPALTPADPQGAARMDQLMNINDWYLFQNAGAVIGFQRVVGPVLLGLPTDEAAIAAALPKAQQAVEEIARLLGTRQFLAADAPTLADLAIAPQLDFLASTPEWPALIRSHDELARWLDRMNARASMQATTWERVVQMAQAPLQRAS